MSAALYMQNICTSLQANNRVNTLSIDFDGLDAFSDSNQRRQSSEGNKLKKS